MNLPEIPTQIWLVVFLLSIGWAPARYVWLHLSSGLEKRDITLPPEDLSWRSNGQFVRSLAILTALMAIGIFVFTPTAKEFARSEFFIPSLFAAMGVLALGTCVMGWYKGRIQPFLKGAYNSYSRHDEPKRYWASLIWNGFVGAGMLAVSFTITTDMLTPRCEDSGDQQALMKALEGCNTLLADTDLPDEERADLFADRGRVHHRLDHRRLALEDYSRAIELAPDDHYSFYNRGLINWRLGLLDSAAEDFTTSLELRPDYADAYESRGSAFLMMGRYAEAVDDFTRLVELDPDDPDARVSRGVAYMWLDDEESAERDFAGLEEDDASWLYVLRARAMKAMQQGQYALAVGYLSDALAIDPADQFSLRTRADAYWELGEKDLARNDDDRLNQLSEVDRILTPDESWQNSDHAALRTR